MSGRVEFAPATLRFGVRTYLPADVVSYRIQSGERSGFLGNVCAFTLFLCLAAILLQAIVGQILPYRTLVGVATLALVGMASMQDTWLEKGNGFYRLFVKLRSTPGEVMVFATSERGEVVLVAERLDETLDLQTRLDIDGGEGRGAVTVGTNRGLQIRMRIFRRPICSGGLN